MLFISDTYPSTYAESMFIEGDNVVIEINCYEKKI